MSETRSLLRSERSLAPAAAALTSACAVSGLVLHLSREHSAWLQSWLLVHGVTGIGTSLALVAYVGLHFVRTLAIRRATVLVSGLLTIPLLVAFLGTGWNLLLFGQRENARWILTLHIASSLACVAVALLHVALHVWFRPLRARRRTEPEGGAPAYRGPLVAVAAFNGVVLATVGLACVLHGVAAQPRDTAPAVANYEYPYGDHPFHPSQTETSHRAFVESEQIANSQRCASCHPDIAAQWFASAHREAASDAAYVRNVNLLAEKKGISTTRYCEGCHGPVALLTGELSPGGKHAGLAGTPANLEGVTCMTCHGIASLVHLKGVGSYEFAPMQDHFFARSRDPLLGRLHNWLVRVRPDQHRRDVGRPLLRDAKICASCHAQFMDKDVNGWGWVKMQDDYSAWLESPYSAQNDETFANSTSLRCQDCHMPLVEANDPSADADGKVRSHLFLGANTVLPALRDDAAHLEATQAFLQSSRLRISIDRPDRDKALQTQHALHEELRVLEETPPYYYLGERPTLRVVVSNAGVGHDFPGGTIDINEAWVEFQVLDAQGHRVFASGLVGDDLAVDPHAHFYRSLPVDRNGALVWRHDLFNMIGESFRRTIKAGGSDIVDFAFDVPDWARSPLTVTASLKYRKLNDRYARWALDDRYEPVPVVDMARDALTIPLRVRKEVE